MYTTLLVGTSKGLLILSNKNATWKIRGVQFEGLQVSMIYIDDRTNTWWVGISHRHWGEKLHHSNNEGKSWQEVTGPNYGEHLYRPGKPATLRKLWVIRQAGEDKPGGLWLGTEPGGLFSIICAVK